jgi:uncharacterized protein (DUF1015 family)
MTGIAVSAGLLFAPFRGLRYADAGTLAARLAPPYDVIDTAQRRALARQDPCNIVQLDLPVAAPGEDPYAAAADILASWQRREILVRDKEPMAYVLRTTTTFEDGHVRSRTGVYLAVAAVPFAAGGKVRPHERTHAGPKEDRRRLTMATGCNLSPIFLLSPDSRGDIAATLAQVTKGEPWATAEALGGTHEIWLVKGPMALRIATLASDEPAYIADGHHRYETAVLYQNEAPKTWRLGAQRTLAHVVSFRDPGLEILPTHRVVEGKPLAREAVLRAANPYFGRALPGQRPTLTAVFADGSEAAMVLRPDADLSAAADLAPQPPARTLPVAATDAVFLKVVVEDLMGREPKLRYTPSAAEARSAAKTAALSVLVPPTELEEVRAVSDAGQIMPPKSTYFAPKVPTGVVMRLFEGEI